MDVFHTQDEAACTIFTTNRQTEMDTADSKKQKRRMKQNETDQRRPFATPIHPSVARQLTVPLIALPTFFDITCILRLGLNTKPVVENCAESFGMRGNVLSSMAARGIEAICLRRRGRERKLPRVNKR